jgi:hypothetical protein
MNVLEELVRVGWNPFDPSEECRRATACPGSDLSPIDRKGIRWRVVTLKLFTKFGKGNSWRDERGLSLMKCASLFVLAEFYPGPEQNPEEAERLYQELDRWHHDVLLPCSARLVEAFKTLGPEYVHNHRKEFEPSYSLCEIENRLGIIDADDDRRMMGLGMAMHYQGTLDPSQPIALELDDLMDSHDFLTQDGSSLARISSKGKITVDPKRVKTALDAHGRVQPSESKGGDELGADPGESESALAAVLAVEGARQVEEARARRIADVEPGQAAWHVLVNLNELLSGELSQTDLAERTGLAPSTINEALRSEARAILALLHAA